VIFYKVIDGGHTWPGQPLQPEFVLGRTCKDFNATEVIWEFFARQRR
jgi:poly(3-hydroxybutyrate) depolymerase